MKALALGGILLLVVVVPPLAVGEDACNPYPIGRCGNSDRENVIFCYVMQGGLMVSGTDPTAQAYGDAATRIPRTPPVTAEDRYALFYLSPASLDAFVDDPLNAPLPRAVLWQESNVVPGLQKVAVKCGTFVWYAECDSWMGPYNIFNKPKDATLA